MKENCRKAVLALALTLAITSTAFADDGFIHTGITPPPPPPATSGIIHTEETESTPEASDVFTEVALNLLQGLLTHF